ncbi:hypothetical protein ACP70R_015372 [Stipagrostis hirtigluma subsp. patula]
MHGAMAAFMAQRMEAVAKTNEIMSRFRPIAPKPALPPPPPTGSSTASSVLRRARKRGRQQDHYLPPASPAPKRQRGAAVPTATWGRYMPELLMFPRSDEEHLLRLTPAGYLAAPPWAPPSPAATWFVPTERDLISRLQAPRVIAPRPMRPLRTTICIDSSNIVAGGAGSTAMAVSRKTAREVEAELERAGAPPAVVSGRDGRVRLANDAYKAMVGQPVCPWLDAVPGAGASRRINGEVVLSVRPFGAAAAASRPPDAVGGAFPCTARISWERDGAVASLTAPCAVERLDGAAGEYRFIWMFDSSRASIVYCIA